MDIKNALSSLKPEKRKFIISVGDEGAILVCAEGRKMLRRVFLSAPHSPELNQILALAPRAPIYMMVDVIDQAYIPQTLPPVSSINVKKLVSRKLAKDFDANDIKSAIMVGKKSAIKKGWDYLFVSIRNTPPFSEWLEVLAEKHNNFAGIYLLPIETISMLPELRKITRHEGDGKYGWQIIVSHNRVGGFRQTVFKNDQLIFTRIAQPIGGQTPDVVAGNIEQETINTLEYIRRLGFEDNDGLEIYIVASSDVKSVLETNNIAANKVSIIPPGDLAAKLGLPTSAEPQDRFGDVVNAMFFINKRTKILRLHSVYTARLAKLFNLDVLVRYASVATAIIAVLGSGWLFYDSFSLQEKLKLAKLNATTSQELLEKEMSKQSSIPVSVALVKELSLFDTKMHEHQYVFFDIYNQYGKVDAYDENVKNINYTAAKIAVSDQGNSSSDGNAQAMEAKFQVDFFYDPARYDRLLEDLDLYTIDIEKSLKGFKTTFTGLPKQGDIKIDADNRNSSKKKVTFDLTIKRAESNAPEQGS